MKIKAKFVHWLVSPFSDIPSEPMFNVIENDRGLPNGSTIGGGTLLTVYGIDVPQFPALAEWEAETAASRRCFRCWEETKGEIDLIRHRHKAHGEDKRALIKDMTGAYWRKFTGTAVAAAVLTLMFASAAAAAWERPLNPDRFPSVGLNVAQTNLSGQRSETSLPNNPALTRLDQGGENTYTHSIGLDVRFPITDQVTLTGSWDRVSYGDTFDRDPASVYRERYDLDGNRWGFGVRMYFNK